MHIATANKKIKKKQKKRQKNRNLSNDIRDGLKIRIFEQ